MSLKLISRAFDNGSAIPDKYSKSGGNISPPMSWTDVPEGTKGLALIVEDPDAPSGSFSHWVVYHIPPASTGLNEGIPAEPNLPGGALQGRNGFGEMGYGGPQPPAGTHRYFFHLYALNTELKLPAGVSRGELDRALQGHVLAETQLMGHYQQRAHGSGAD